MIQYLDLVNTVLEKGTIKTNRTGTDTLMYFGYHYKVDLQKGVYDLKFKFLKPLDGGGDLFLEMGQNIKRKQHLEDEKDELIWRNVALPAGAFDFTPFYRKGRKSIFPLWVEIQKVE